MANIDTLIRKTLQESARQGRLNRSQQKKRFEREQRQADQREWKKPYQIRNKAAAMQGKSPALNKGAVSNIRKSRAENASLKPTGIDKLEDTRLRREIAAGRLDPSHATGMSQQGLQTFAASRPDLFGGAEKKEAAFTPKNIADYRKTAEKRLSEQYESEKGLQGEPPKDKAGNPISRRDYIFGVNKETGLSRRDEMLKRWLGDLNDPGGGEGEGAPSISPDNQDKFARNNLNEGLTTSWQKADGTPVDASKVENNKLPDGTQVYKRFALARPGGEVLGTDVPKTPSSAIESVGFGRHAKKPEASSYTPESLRRNDFGGRIARAALYPFSENESSAGGGGQGGENQRGQQGKTNPTQDGKKDSPRQQYLGNVNVTPNESPIDVESFKEFGQDVQGFFQRNIIPALETANMPNNAKKDLLKKLWESLSKSQKETRQKLPGYGNK